MQPNNSAGQDVELSVSQFVAILNQTLDYAYPNVVITGELANLRISKQRWVYFDLKDDMSTVKFFGNVQQLPGPLEDGMLLKVRGQPRLHNLYGFSVNVQTMQPAGEGSLKRAADLLKAKLAQEGLFDPSRKRPLPYPPERVGLITSTQSAAYADFVKIINARWRGLMIDVADVQVQGEAAPSQLVAAIEYFNAQAQPPDVLVMIRGGGSAEDLAAYNTEGVTRAVAASRVPTLVAIGHEVDISLAELAADLRASTPSNAAELMVPDREHALSQLSLWHKQLDRLGQQQIAQAGQRLKQQSVDLSESVQLLIKRQGQNLISQSRLLEALNPSAILRRGYAIVRQPEDEGVVRSVSQLAGGAIVGVQLIDGSFDATVNNAVLVNLQRDDLDVDTALQDYQRGLELVKELEDYLKNAETKIQQIKAQS